MFPISALTGEGCVDLVNAWVARLPEAPPYFPPDQFTDQPERFLVAELIREQAILATREEVPYAIAVLIDNFEEKKTLVRIRATLYVEREGQKGILIGKRGETMKKIGTLARREIESILGSRVFLELFVKVQSNWRQNPAMSPPAGLAPSARATQPGTGIEYNALNMQKRKVVLLVAVAYVLGIWSPYVSSWGFNRFVRPRLGGHDEDVRLTSPDGVLDVVVVRVNPGAFSSFSYFFYMAPKGTKRIEGVEYPILSTSGGDAPSVRWERSPLSYCRSA